MGYICGNATSYGLAPTNSKDAGVVDINISIPVDAFAEGAKTAVFEFHAFARG